MQLIAFLEILKKSEQKAVRDTVTYTYARLRYEIRGDLTQKAKEQ
jgi:hypothetical protein